MKRSIFRLLIIFPSIFFLTSCNDEKDDITDVIDKGGSIESAVTVEHLTDSTDVLITKHIIWSKFNLNKEVYYRDTIPALGYTYAEAENEDGDTKNVSVKKDYEVYITVK
ncbi:MAG: hypothetical protein ACOVO1_05745 [Chitinophagaceae bacterium]